jgi:DNA modification methylase
LKSKDLIGIPWMLAFALRADGWYLRQDIIWHKPNPMPESVKDRCTKAHEYVFLLSKSARYYYDYEAVLEPATGYDGRKDTMFKGSEKYKDSGQTFAERGHERWQYKNLQPDGQQPNTMHLNRLDGEEYLSPVRNKRSVWTVTTKPYKGAHYATFNPDLIKPCILAGAPEGGIVFDPFVGSGTTVATAIQLGRKGIGLDLSLTYLYENAKDRIEAEMLPLLTIINQSETQEQTFVYGKESEE